MKPTFILYLSIILLFCACKNDTKKENNRSIESHKIQLPEQKTVDPKKQSNKAPPLNKEQLNDFFPEYIGTNKRFNIFIVPGEPLATASYGSYQSSYNYSINDAVKDNSVIKNFEMSYSAKQNAPEGTEYIIKERDGYKTIAFLQPKIKRFDIQFVYKNRFRIVLEGPEHPNVLWSYIKKADLEKLDNY